HLESSYELVAKLILKDFRVSFLYFFIQKRCWRSSPTSKSIEPKIPASQADVAGSIPVTRLYEFLNE
ncbi:hypothetical protein, partial [Enterococcus durans]